MVFRESRASDLIADVCPKHQLQHVENTQASAKTGAVCLSDN